MIKTAFILAGGKGTRLSTIVSDVPKPMAPIKSKPFLEYQIKFLTNAGINNIVLLTGYKSEVIRDYFLDGSEFNCNITYSNEDFPLGTGGAIKKAFDNSKVMEALVLNGDSFFNFQIEKFFRNLNGNEGIALKHLKVADRYGAVKVDSNNNIISFSEKNPEAMNISINAGIYFLKKETCDLIPNGFCSLENEIFPILTKNRKLLGINCDGEFIDIGIPEDYHKSQELIPSLIKI